MAVALLLAGPCWAQEAVNPSPYECLYTEDAITIDGKADEAAWGRAEALSFFLPVTHEPATTVAKGRLLWDENFLYVFIEAEDHELKAVLESRDDHVFKDDVLETFVRTPAGRRFNVEVNAKGAFLDSSSEGRLGFNFQDIKLAVALDGTLNDGPEGDEGWALELALPFDELLEEGQHPENGEEWTFHLSRYDYAEAFEGGKELSSTTKFSAVNYHLWEEWGVLLFTR